MPPLMLVYSAVANIHNTVLYDIKLSSEIADVSFHSTVRFENVSLADVTFSSDTGVVSTSYNDYTPININSATYMNEDDAGFDVLLEPVPLEDRGVFGEQYVIVDDIMSDCVYFSWEDEPLLPGCPPKARLLRAQLRNRVLKPFQPHDEYQYYAEDLAYYEQGLTAYVGSAAGAPMVNA